MLLDLPRARGQSAPRSRFRLKRHDSNPAEQLLPLTKVGSIVFFPATDGTRGRELWKSDGTEAGTRTLTRYGSSRQAGSVGIS